jgi:hypothetical protein
LLQSTPEKYLWPSTMYFQVEMATMLSASVKALFRKYPMASNAVVYGTLITGAEFTQQTITKKILVSCKLPQLDNHIICEDMHIHNTIYHTNHYS